MKLKYNSCYLFLTLGLFVTSVSHAASTSFTTQVARFDRLLNFTGPSAIGLSKFDPALGTLTAINLSAVGDYSATFRLSAEIDNPTAEDQDGFFDAPHSINVGIGHSGSISIDGPGNTGIRTTFQKFSLAFSCAGEGEFACTEEDDIEAFGTYSASSSTDTDLLSQPLLARIISNNLLDLFVGSGDIDSGVLELGISAFFEDDFLGGLEIISSNNITLAPSIEGDFILGPTDVTIEYEFTPTVVPVPAAVWLFGSALAGFVTLSRRKTT